MIKSFVSKNNLSFLDDKVILITGGTGSFGRAVLRRLLGTNVSEIRIFSRDEKKQNDMRFEFDSSRVNFYLGDVRDYQSVRLVMQGVDYVFHAAALKQVPSCEFHPIQAVQTNILGTQNVIDASISAGISKAIFLSTDKAVYPINAMGISKAMMEKLVLASARQPRSLKTSFCCTRYGNVMASRGSVIPLFVDQIINKRSITITDPNMTRFMMTLSDAVDLVLFALENGKSGDILVQKAPAASIDTLAKALTKLLGVPDHPIKTIGVRHGEKQYESLLSTEELFMSKDLGDYYRVPIDSRELDYHNYIDKGISQKNSVLHPLSYDSNSTSQLSIDQMSNLLLRLESIHPIISGHSTTITEF